MCEKQLSERRLPTVDRGSTDGLDIVWNKHDKDTEGLCSARSQETEGSNIIRATRRVCEFQDWIPQTVVSTWVSQVLASKICGGSPPVRREQHSGVRW